MDEEGRAAPATLNPQDGGAEAMATLAAPSMGLGKPLGALPKLPGLPPMPPPVQRPLAPSADVGVAIEARERVVAVKEKAKKDSLMYRETHFEEQENKSLQHAAPGASAAEVRARAEHLKKQRDLILAQRKKAREAAAAAAAPPNPVAAAPPPQSRPPPMPPSSNLKNGAGYSSGGDNVARAGLTTVLASNLRASLLGEDQSNHALEERIAAHKRADLAATKDRLRQEMGVR